MKYLLAGLLSLALLAAAFFAGRSTKKPETLVITEPPLERIREVHTHETAKETVKTVTKLVTYRPDGSKETEKEDTTEHTKEGSKGSTDMEGVEIAEPTVPGGVVAAPGSKVSTPRESDVPSRDNFRVSVLGGIDFSSGVDTSPVGVIGLSVERRFLGPVWFGAWGLSSGVAGVSLGGAW